TAGPSGGTGGAGAVTCRGTTNSWRTKPAERGALAPRASILGGLTVQRYGGRLRDRCLSVTVHPFPSCFFRPRHVVWGCKIESSTPQMECLEPKTRSGDR